MRTAPVCALLALLACAPPPDPRAAEVADVLARADADLARARPGLLAGKYRKMAGDLFDYYRGTLPLYAHDWSEPGSALSRSRFAPEVPLALSLGDAHPENFGTMVAGDGSIALEPNDFDSAERLPWLWDVRRLATGVVLFADILGGEAHARRSEVALGVARGYREGLAALAAGGSRPRLVAPTGSAAIDDLLRRAAKDAGSHGELSDFTLLENGARRLRRGVLDPTDPTSVLGDLSEVALQALPGVLQAYAPTRAVPAAPDGLRVLDAVRRYGSGVASWPRVRVLVLLRGPSDDPADDQLLELKELVDSHVGGWLPPGVYADDVQSRVLGALHTAWARPDADPAWGAATWLGLPVQLKTEASAFKTMKVEKLTGVLGTPTALADVGRVLGSVVARVHASTPEAPELAARISAALAADPDGFDAEQTDAAIAYADQVEADWGRFGQQLVALGPTLGVTPGPGDGPPPELAPLFLPPEGSP